jgi:hypothetical protein
MTQKTTGFYAFFADMIYTLPTASAFEEKLQSIPKGWKLLDTFMNEDGYYYRGAAFINEETKEVLVTSAGTDPMSINDLWDDAKLTFGYVPNKMQSLKTFADRIAKKLDLEGKVDYKIDTTGHSLGGVLSDLLKVEFESKGFETGISATFDNPGSRPVLKYALEQKMFSGAAEVSLDKGFKAHQNKPNLINKTNPQAGEEEMMIAKKTEEDQKQESKGYFSKLYKVASSAVSYVSKITGINKIFETLDTHKTDNFVNHYGETDGKNAQIVGKENGQYVVDLTKSTIRNARETDQQEDGDFFAWGENSVIRDEIKSDDPMSESFAVIDGFNFDYEGLQNAAYPSDNNETLLSGSVFEEVA